MTYSTGHSHFRPALLVAIGFAAIAFSATESSATVILPNVPAGTPYEILFVTLDTTAATSTNISSYNTFVTNEANLSPTIAAFTASHHLTWQAVASTAAVDAIVNAPDNGLAVYNTQGIELATAATGIYNSGLLSPVQYNQFGNSDTTPVWDGATLLGGAAAGIELGMQSVQYGDSQESNSNWLEGSTAGSSNLFSVYALSSPVPEPATIALLGSALLAIGGMRLVRRRTLA